MESLLEALLVAIILSAPVAAIAQSNQPLSRAEVRAELVQYERAGYSPLDWSHYAADIQAAPISAFGQYDHLHVEPGGYGSTAITTSQTAHSAEYR
ncbi:DUF4148 domain-containing protein [Paraburkholderia sediminicola]|uniref:DUF4148 domain-containing protein n=1 Tax=Paraburkholderia sediminicola TaxID=458836 RepID=UPI0038BC0259